MENKSTATITITCWGCCKTIDKPYSNYLDCQKELDNLLEEGWIKRSFGSNAWAWFCSHDCAYNSNHARIAELWWQKHGKKNMPWIFTVSTVLVIIYMILSLAYSSVR
jgi:hypothetical protein